MERLTYKNYIEEYEVNFEKSSYKNWSIAESDTHIKVTGEPIEKLGELEDVLEKYGIENLEEYIKSNQITNYAQNHINTLEEENKRVNTVLNLVKQENNDLQQELTELKQKAIVPQFKPNDDAYIIWNGTIIDVKISSIVTINEYIVKTCHSDLHHDGISCIDENEVFATKEEAEQKLAEIRGKDE